MWYHIVLLSQRRLDDSVDCSQRPVPEWLAGGRGAGEGAAGGEDDEDMGDFMAEILAEEVREYLYRIIWQGDQQETAFNRETVRDFSLSSLRFGLQ